MVASLSSDGAGRLVANPLDASVGLGTIFPLHQMADDENQKADRITTGKGVSE